MRSERDAVVVGGGFFGCMTALELRRRYRQVVLLEQDDDLLRRASYHNQARVHGGYHYPRSLRTALRSRINFPRFVEQFGFCIERSFDKYYAVARQFSKVTARQFRNFFEHIQAPIEPAPAAVRRLFNSDLIEEVFRVTEYAFDAVRLREWLRRQLLDAGIEICLQTEASRVRASAGGWLLLEAKTPQGPTELLAREVFNCTYANLNHLLAASGLPLIPLQQEWTEMALVSVPEPLAHMGVTVMCGPFFSVMPFPPRGLHSLSHVRYTPHAAWRAGNYRPSPHPNPPPQGGREKEHPHPTPPPPGGRASFSLPPGGGGLGWGESSPRYSHFPWMVRDAARFLPILNECRYVDSLWEIKSVLPRSEGDDSRPILFQHHHGLANLHCVLGAKIDNIFDLLEEMDDSPRQERRSA
jgi:glycine/D-amino acid oxidase-like deaminating enzyme